MKHCTLIAAVINSAIGADKNHLSLFNSGGQWPLEVWRIEATAHLAATVTGTGLSIYVHRIATVGTGTAVAIRRANNRGLALPASVTSLSAVTVSPVAASELAGISLSTEEAGNAISGLPGVMFQADPEKGIDPILLWQNEGIVVRQAALVSAGGVSLFIYFRVRRSK